MPAFALPLAPAVGEGLLWGAGLLGSGLTALGIIENKDAIRDGISDFGSWISNGVGNGIKAWSEAMSPKGPAGPNPNYDVATGKPIAVADVTRVQRPIPVFRQQIQPRPFGATRSVRHDSDGEPIFFPWQTGSPERPIRLNPVTVTGSRIMRTDAEGAQPEQPATDSEGGTTAPASPPTPEPEGGDNNRGGKWYKKLWETSGEGSPKWGPKAGRFVRNWGIRVPAYTGAAAPVVDVVGNIFATGLEPDSVQHDWQWKVTNMRFMPERTLFKGIGKSYMTQPTSNPAVQRDTTTNNSAPRDTVPAVSNQQLPDSVVTNANNDWEEWLRTRQTE